MCDDSDCAETGILLRAFVDFYSSKLLLNYDLIVTICYILLLAGYKLYLLATIETRKITLPNIAYLF